MSKRSPNKGPEPLSLTKVGSNGHLQHNYVSRRTHTTFVHVPLQDTYVCRYAYSLHTCEMFGCRCGWSIDTIPLKSFDLYEPDLEKANPLDHDKKFQIRWLSSSWIKWNNNTLEPETISANSSGKLLDCALNGHSERIPYTGTLAIVK